MNPLGWEAARSGLSVLFGVLLPLLPICIVACAVGLVFGFVGRPASNGCS
jgi:VIT1/CCC1 family predicted Fe2+/Mn2+ transporter